MVNLEPVLKAAKEAGLPPDQIRRFLVAEYVPQPKQLEFHAVARLADLPDGPELIALGGARGPGKSHMAFAQGAIDDCQRIDGLKVLFLRKIGKSAKESLNDLRKKVLKRVPHSYKEAAGIISFPNGSLILIGNFKDEKDIEKYLGLEYDLIIIEEATQLSEKKVDEIRGSLRTTKPNWRTRIYLTTNPGGIGHQWFKEWFVLPFRKRTEGQAQHKINGRFIPATYKDNAFLKPEYVRYLESLTGILGRMWRDGDWDVGAGTFFTNWKHDQHVIKPFKIPSHWPMWASLDYGFAHPTAVYWHTKNDEGTIYTIAEHVASRWLAEQHAARIQAITEQRFNRSLSSLTDFPAGRDCFAERGDSSGKTIAQQYAEFSINLSPANVSRVAGAAEMLRRLGNEEAAISPTWYIFDTCPRLVNLMPALQSDPKRPEDVLKVDADVEGKGGDDEYDAVRYGLMAELATVAGGFGVSY